MPVTEQHVLPPLSVLFQPIPVSIDPCLLYTFGPTHNQKLKNEYQV